MPHRLLYSFYGDDFTGSTDALESLTREGIRTVLFLRYPSKSDLNKFKGVQAIGVAGMSRAMSPAEMSQELVPIFSQLRDLGASIVHYKTCSTFDSSPDIGSIGYAIDIGQEVFSSPYVPLVVGVPQLGRYCVFGNLFARSGLDSEPFRLDRHPAMRNHPVTPMQESDLRVHLSKQTTKRIGLVDVMQLSNTNKAAETSLSSLLISNPDIVLFDVLNELHLERIGHLIWKQAQQSMPLFVAGSSGVGYALTSCWRTSGYLASSPVADKAVRAVDQLLVVSGSCSPITAMQSKEALQHGFADILLQPQNLIDPETRQRQVDTAIEQGFEILRQGKSLLVYTCKGPDDPAIKKMTQEMKSAGYAIENIRAETGRIIGESLGRILKRLLERSGLRRVVVAGGDTSGYVAKELGIDALEVAAPLAPGAPLCQAHAKSNYLNGLEIVFKGGQIGGVDFFQRALGG